MSSLNDSYMNFLGSVGYTTGALNDRLKAWLENAQIHSDRSSLVSFVSSNTPVDGALYFDGTVFYQGSTGATDISDLSGLTPLDFDSPRHHGAVGDGSTDDTSSVQASMNSSYPVRMKRGDAYKCTSAVSVPSSKYVDFNGAKMVRGYNDLWLLENSTARSTNNNTDITLIDPWLEDDGTAGTRGNFLLMSGVTRLRVVRPKIIADCPYDATYGAWAQFYEGDDISVEGAYVDTEDAGLWSDSVHVGRVTKFRYTDFIHKAGDDAIALHFPPTGYSFIGSSNSASSGVFIGSGYVSSATANGIRLGADDTASNARVWKDVTISDITFGACSANCVQMTDTRAAANIVDTNDRIRLSNLNFGSQNNTRIVNLAGNPDIENSANYTQHNFGTVVFEGLNGVQAGTEFFRAGGADNITLRGFDFRNIRGTASSGTVYTFRQTDDLQVSNGYMSADTTSNCVSLIYALKTIFNDVVIEDLNPAFRCFNFALNSDQASSLHMNGGAILNATRGIDDTGTGTITDFRVIGTDIEASTADYNMSTVPGGTDIRLDRKRLAYSSGATGGTASAGAGNQYVEMAVNGTTYKVLHDGTV